MKSLGGLRNQGRLLAKKRRRRQQGPGGKKGMETEDASLAARGWAFVGETPGAFYTFLSFSDPSYILRLYGNIEVVPNPPIWNPWK